MLAHDSTQAVTGDLELRVPRGRTDDLRAGVESVLDGVDAVVAVEEVEITGVRPESLDLYADVTARLRVASEADAGTRPGDAREAEATAAGDRIAARLADGFGVTAVRALSPAVDPDVPAADRRPPD